MKKSFRAVLSVLCIVTLLASLIIPSIVLPAAAYTFGANEDVITYTFDGTDFKANATVAGKRVSGGQYSVTGGSLKIAGDKNLYDGAPRSIIFNNGNDILRLDAGAYAVNFKYRYEYSKHTNNLYCTNYNSYKANAPYFNFVINTPEGTGVPAGEIGTIVVNDFITPSESVSGSTQMEKTVLVNVTGSGVNFGIRSAWLECDVYIDEITIARKTSIEIIPTDGTNTAFAEVVSGVPGTTATLPEKDDLDGVISGKVFEGFYADAAFTTPITQAMTFPTDALKRTVYAKMVTDNAYPEGTIIFDFDDNNAGMKTGSNKVENITVSGGAYGINVNKPAAAQGNVLSINGNVGSGAHNHGDTRDIIFNDGTAFTALPAGDYEITYDYFVKYIALSDMASSCSSCQGFFNGNNVYQHIKFATFKKSGFNATSGANVRGALSDGLVAADVVTATNPTASGSGTVTLTVTQQMVTDGANYFGIRISTLTHSVWLDNIVIKPVNNQSDPEEPKGVTIDFDNNVEAGATGLVNIISDGTNKVLSIRGNNVEQNRSEGIKDKNGNEYTLTAGVWKATYKYKIIDTYSKYTTVYMIHGFGVYKGELCNIDTSQNYTSGRKLVDKNLVTSTEVGVWKQDSVTFTLEGDVTNLGFAAFGNTVVYLDDVVFTPVVEEPAKSVAMDFEQDTANYTGSSMLKIQDGTGKDGNPSKVFYASSNDQIRTQLVKDKNGNVYSLTKGVWKMTYDYKVPTDKNQKIWLLHDVMITKGQLADDGATTDYTSGLKLSGVNLAKVTTSGDTWLSDSIIINVTSETGVKNIGFGAETVSGNSGVYLDNVVFTQVKEEYVNLTFDTQGGNDIPAVMGIIGETITVADPVKTGFDFTGWFEDALCTVPSDMKFKVGVTTLYAGWSEQNQTGLEFNFDTKNSAFKTGGSWSGGMYTLQSDPKGTSGKTLGLNAITTNHNHGDRRDILFNDGTNAITLEAGIYKIDYKYYAIYRENGFFGSQSANYTCNDGCNKFDAIYSNPSSIVLRFGVVGSFGTTAENARAASSGELFDMALITSAYESRWTDGWAVLEVTEKMVNEGKNKLVLSAYNLPFTVYLDDIKLNKIDAAPVTISFDSKGGSSVSAITVNAYTAVNHPVPTKAGYTFTGWVDKNGNAAPTYAPTVNTTYYATWEEAGKYAFIDMDNGFLAGSLDYGSGYYTVSNKFKDDPDHNKTLRYKVTDNKDQARIHLLSSEGKLAELAPGKLYKVTFDYYVESLPAGANFSVDFTVDHNGRWLYEPHIAKRLTGGNILSGLTNKSTNMVGKWMTKEVALVVPNNITNATLGIFAENGKGAEIYFDNIKFESIEGDTVLLTYVIPATGQTSYIMGKKGTAIDKSKIPVLDSKKLEFAGWYADEEFKTVFNANVFPSKSMTVYGKTQLNSKGVHISFEDYPYKGDTSSSKISLSVMDAVNDGISYDGDGWALKFDNTNPEKQTTENKRVLLNLDSSTFPLQDGANYLFTYRYYIVNSVSAGTVRVGFNTGVKDSMWGTTPEITQVASASAIGKHGRWITGYATGKVEAPNANTTFLQAQIGVPLNAVVYFDDFIVQQIPEGYISVVYSTDYGKTPDPVIVKIGSTINLPNKISGMPADKKFTGWIANGMKYGTGSVTVKESTSFAASIVTQKFTESFEKWSSQYQIDDSALDNDYAIYDGNAQGNSSDNVKSGRYSLHRIGKEPAKKGYSLYMNNDISDKFLSFGNIYTVSMWVKVVNPVHTTGGIEIRNNDTARHAWGSSVDPMKVVAIKDIADGQWHKISYTFEAMARYVSIFTPGNLEIFIDDVTIEYTPNAIISMGANYVEYVPAFLTEEGKYVNPEENKDTLNEFELVKRTETVTEGGSHIVTLITQNIGATIAIIAGTVVILAGIAVVVIVLIKKRKAKEVK